MEFFSNGEGGGTQNKWLEHGRLSLIKECKKSLVHFILQKEGALALAQWNSHEQSQLGQKGQDLVLAAAGLMHHWQQQFQEMEGGVDACSKLDATTVGPAPLSSADEEAAGEK